MSGNNINFEDKKIKKCDFYKNKKNNKYTKMRITDNSAQWLKNLANDNLKREIELRNRQHKANAKDHDICLWLLHNEEYKRKNGLKLVQNSLVPLDYPYNTVQQL